MKNIKKFSEKSIHFFQKVFSAIIPQGKELFLTIILQCGFLIFFWLWITLSIHEPNRFWFFSPGIFLLGILGAMLAGLIAAAIVKSFQFIPYILLAGIAFTLVIGAYTTSSIANNWQTVLCINLWLALPPIFIGFGRAYIQKQNRGKWIYRVVGWFIFVIGVLSIIMGMIWISIPGFSNHNPIPQIVDSRAETQMLHIENPANQGNYPVLTLTYGSGTDKNRPEYADQAALITKSVDGSAFLPSLDKLPKWLYQLQWGFDKSELPLNGRVWFPQGDGPFPLILIVHGNHTALDFSDEGYAYLGELLASRGMIVVSVDENFLNSTWINAISNDYSHQENDARGWMLLQHLEQFRKWHNDINTPFYKKIDWGKIALIGHSRGGEAVTEAANFNTLGIYPDNGNIKFPDKFNISTLIAIAPVDNQYNPASKETPVENVNYLVIQGSADADLKNFPGQAAYSRVSFTTNPVDFYFKSSIYLHRANHGQFNTTWGDADNGKLSYYLVDRQLLLDETVQQQTAQVVISAFLEAALNQNEAYQTFFKNPRSGSTWLTPEINIWSQYADSNDSILVNFEEDINLHTGTTTNIVINAKHFDSWRETILYGNRNRSVGNSVVSLAWNTNNRPPAEYSIHFNKSMSFDQKEMFVFSAAVETDDDDDENKEIIPVNFSIKLSDGQSEVTLTTNEYALLYENPALLLNKAAFMNQISTADPVLQSVVIPIKDFLSVNPDLNLSSIKSISFIFDQSDQGKIWIDDIALR